MNLAGSLSLNTTPVPAPTLTPMPTDRYNVTDAGANVGMTRVSAASRGGALAEFMTTAKVASQKNNIENRKKIKYFVLLKKDHSCIVAAIKKTKNQKRKNKKINLHS